MKDTLATRAIDLAFIKHVEKIFTKLADGLAEEADIDKFQLARQTTPRARQLFERQFEFAVEAHSAMSNYVGALTAEEKSKIEGLTAALRATNQTLIEDLEIIPR